MHLPWLVAPSADFRTQVRQFHDKLPDLATLFRLAARSMDLGQLAQLRKVVTRHRDEIARGSDFQPVRLALIGSHTVDYIADALVATGLRHRVLISLQSVPYGQVAQAVLDGAAGLRAGEVDFVLFSLDAKFFGLDQPRLSEGESKIAVDHAVDQVALLVKGVRERLGAAAIFQTIVPSADSLFGSFDAQVQGSSRAMIAAFNARLPAVISRGDLIVDIAHVASTAGLVHWHDTRLWHGAKMPFAPEMTPLYADHVCRVIGAALGKSRKCLVLDLDNTLWGGVIGDDGLEGIVLGNGNAIGEAHVAIQRLALELRERGIILAVCSKNEEANALLPFKEHEEMLLREPHITCFVANWNDKAGNLRDIATALNIGLDSLVFLDDNAAERELVRRELPEVAVPEVGADPADYPAMIARAGYFEAVSFSSEDRQRAEMYRANAERRGIEASVTNLAVYLASLEMVMTALPFDAVGRARISQLVNKSNQFNVTTKRYSERDIAAFELNPTKFTLQVRLEDKFGDNGMISIIIFDKCAEAWTCDTWLMSCRVLGRGVEQAVLNEVVAAARAGSANKLRATYIPTKKNGIVRDLFERLGFSRIGEETDGVTSWELDLADYAPTELSIRIISTQGYIST
jgi:FkbH-like protein